jgi:hypothetical protein
VKDPLLKVGAQVQMVLMWIVAEWAVHGDLAIARWLDGLRA